MDPRIPPILHPVLQDYARRIQQEMPGQVSAFYLVGSIGLGDFNPRLSDIDFVAILSSKATAGDFEKIFTIHQGIAAQSPKWKFEGMYFQARDLGCLDGEVEPFLNYHDGKLKWADRFGLSSVTWWILKHCGIAVFGPPVQSLTFTVDMDELIRRQRENLNSYWASWTTRPDGILALLSDWGIQWTVLGVLRQFYTIHERQITSKTKAGEYALGCVPDRWHPIIREAIALREEPKRSYYGSRIRRAREAYGFLQYMIRSCNDYLDLTL